MLKIFFLIGLIQLGYINCQALYGQCGGKGYTGPTKCPANSYCKVSNEYYSQCVPGSNNKDFFFHFKLFKIHSLIIKVGVMVVKPQSHLVDHKLLMDHNLQVSKKIK